MTTYIAIFKIRLPCPIAVGESSLPDLTVNPSSGYLKRALLRVSPVNGAITEVTVWATYSHDSLRHCVVAGQTEMDGVAVVGEAGRLVPPWDIAHSIIRPLLYQISAVTLQAHVFWDMEDGLTKWITAFTWRRPTVTRGTFGYNVCVSQTPAGDLPLTFRASKRPTGHS